MKQAYARHASQTAIDLEFDNLYRELSSYGAGPAFSVHRNGTDSAAYAAGSYQKVLFTTAEYDTHKQFDLALSRFEPRNSGLYQLNAAAYFNPGQDNKDYLIAIYKNGVVYKQITNNCASAIAVSIDISTLVRVVSPGDYYEIFVLHNFTTSTVLSGGTSLTYFNGCRIG